MQRKTNIDPKKKAFRDLMLDALDNEISSQKKSVNILIIAVAFVTYPK